MKTILYNTISQRTEGPVREGSFNDIYDSRFSTIAGVLPEFILELEVVFTTQVDHNPTTHRLDYIWEIDIANLKRTQVWITTELTPEEKDVQSLLMYHQQLLMGGWHHPQFAKRIIAPVELVMQYPQIETWFRINDLPIVRQDTTLFCYCNVILETHNQLVDALQGIVSIENIPTPT
jgi:hypothetical protein